MITEHDFWYNEDLSWDNINEYKTLSRDYKMMFEAIMLKYKRDKNLGNNFTITPASHPTYYQIQNRWDYIKCTLDAPILSNVTIKIGDIYEINGKVVIIDDIFTSSLGDGQIRVKYSDENNGHDSCEVEILGKLLISKKSNTVAPETEDNKVFKLSEYEINNLINKHEISVSNKYRDSQVECRFTSFGHTAAITAVKEVIELANKFIEKK